MPNIYFVQGYDSYTNKNVVKLESEKLSADTLANSLTAPHVHAVWYKNEKDLINFFNTLLTSEA
jgi:hypothetical protein